MTQRSLHWDGASAGDADALTVNAADGIGWRLANASYESPFVDRALRMVLNGDGNRGVLKGWLNELAVTGVATPVAVNTGGAVIYGMPYENTSSVNVAVATPTTDTRYDYVVIRRNWRNQTARITLITGTEGGGIPAMTQNPVPAGTIYDIPLATLEVDTGGNITVTDAREFCRFGTGVRDDAFGATHLSSDSIDWADRATRTERLFIGAPELYPLLNAAKWSYSTFYSYTMGGAPTWDGAANEESWRHTGAGRRGVIGTFRTPANYAGGSMNAYVWWVNNAVVAATFYIYTSIRGREESWVNCVKSGENTYVSSSGAVSDVFKSDGGTLSAADVSDNGDGGMWDFAIIFYNPAGAEDIGIMGLEIEYTGYI